jgi:flagellar L-ring protein precursor FlgH
VRDTERASDIVRHPVVAQPATPGAIYSAGSGFSLFEDPKARVAGDLLTVLLVEKTQAKKEAATSTSKDSSADISNPTLLGRPLSRHGTPIGTFGLEGSRGFDGKGDTSQSNQLTGSLTVTVLERLPNGNLVVAGEKNLELGQGSERVRLSGVVRPVDVAPDNTIKSDRVADARIEYVGRGALADANAQGWLSRFFNSPWFPF